LIHLAFSILSLFPTLVFFEICGVPNLTLAALLDSLHLGFILDFFSYLSAALDPAALQAAIYGFFSYVPLFKRVFDPSVMSFWASVAVFVGSVLGMVLRVPVFLQLLLRRLPQLQLQTGLLQT
jgi:hypothetical protein